MRPDEDRLVNDLERMLHGKVTPTMVSILNDASIHVAILSGLTLEQIVMQFAQQLSAHVPGVAGVEIKMYGYGGMQVQPGLPNPPTPVMEAPTKDDETAWKLLRGLDLGDLE